MRLDTIVEMQAFMAVVPDRYVILNPDSIIKLVSASFCKLSGYKEDELIGHNIKMLIPEDTPNPHDESLTHYSSGEETSKRMKTLSGVDMQRKDGSTIKVNVKRSRYKIHSKMRYMGVVDPI